MSDALSLEHRVAIVANPETFEKLKKIVLPANIPSLKELTSVSSLDEIENKFNEYATVILTARDHIDHVVVRANFQTPVIYYADDRRLLEELSANSELLSRAKDKLLENRNLFAIANNDIIASSVNSAIDAHKRIKTYVEKNINGLQTLERQSPPRFRNSLAVVRRYEDSLRALDTLNRQLPQHQAAWGAIEKSLLIYTANHDQNLAETLAPVAMSFSDQYPDYILAKSVLVLGEHEVGEESVAHVQNLDLNPDTVDGNILSHAYLSNLPFVMFRIIKPRGNITAKQIADQRVKDSQYFNVIPGFKTPFIMAPLHFSDFPKLKNPNSFIVFQYVPGLPLHKFLPILNKEYQESEKKGADENKLAKIRLLRNTLIEKYVDDCAFWVNKCIPTTCVRPKPEELIQYYRERIADVPKSFNERTYVVFDEKMSALWNEATKVLGAMTVDDKNIVRNRDSSLANAIIYDKNYIPKKEYSLEECLTLFGVTARDKIDMNEVNNRFYNVDLQYRYGHVLEDLAQIATFYEAAFLLRGKDNRFTREKVFALRDRFISKIENQDLVKNLKNDDFTFHVMLLYRAIRKMYLFTDYWVRACEEKENGKLSDDAFKIHKQRFEDNITHHYLLAKELCARVSVDLDHEWKKIPEYKTEVEQVKKIRTALKCEFSVVPPCNQLNDESIDKCLSMLTGKSEDAPKSAIGLNYVRANVLCALLKHIEEGFESKGLKYYQPGAK